MEDPLSATCVQHLVVYNYIYPWPHPHPHTHTRTHTHTHTYRASGKVDCDSRWGESISEAQDTEEATELCSYLQRGAQLLSGP